jgi:hypothetical protein
MARKPNYNFERMERERLKAIEAAKKAKAKAERKAEKSGAAPADDDAPQDD